ncbi:phosphate ABC transporter substrate-binding protein [Candidatus Fermentibacterales bacterium]|nr:phosphate ABC transporter substrate-binding protein [Candidatus Fermentibacterales bacterium]
MTGKLRALALAAGVLAIVGGCGEGEQPEQGSSGAPDTTATVGQPALSGRISVAGSTTVQPLAELLSEAFSAEYPDVEITVQGGGSSVGVKSAGEGTVEIGMASREIKNSEFEEFPGIVVHTIARDGIAIVSHPDAGVDRLTTEQVRNIFNGEITDWSEVGGSAGPVITVAREEGSGTRAAFEELVMDGTLITGGAVLQPSNGAVRTTVSTTPMSIGFLSFGYLDETVRSIAVDGVLPNEETAASGEYPVVRPLNMITLGQPEGISKAWLDFIMSPDGQAIVSSEGYIAVN